MKNIQIEEKSRIVKLRHFVILIYNHTEYLITATF